MEEGIMIERFEKLISFSFISSLLIGFAFISIAILQDYIMSAFYDVAVVLQANGDFGTWVLTMIESIDEAVLMLPGIIDILWLASFVLLAGGLVQASYYAKRQGYFSAITMLLYGTLIILTLTSFFVEFSTWFQTEVMAKILPTMTMATPFFSYYITNIGFINLFIVVLCILVNVFDFDLSSYMIRKEKENITTTQEEII